MRLIVCVLLTSMHLLATEGRNAEVFSKIYATGEWGRDENGRGCSGEGSNPKNARMYIDLLQRYLRDLRIKTVVDLGCGDWQIGGAIDWSGIQYTGIDVVASVIADHQEKFSSSNISFICADGADFVLPAADLLICKEVMQHLPNPDVQKIVQQCSRFKYCIFVNDVDPVRLTAENTNIEPGGHRGLDLTKPPFNLKGTKLIHYLSETAMKEVLLIDNSGVVSF